jgi:hypothetical protein
MRPRILNYKVAATHETISTLGSIQSAVSISDFDAFLFDPDGIPGDAMAPDALQRKSDELRDLVERKGGVIICLLRPNDWRVNVGQFGMVDKYWLLQAAARDPHSLITRHIKSGSGSSINRMRSARGATSAYFQVLSKNLQFTAYLALNESQIAQSSGLTFAVNSVGHVIAAEFPLGEGLVSFVPIPRDVTGDRLGAALVQTVSAHFSRQPDLDIPEWAHAVAIPGAKEYDDKIATLSSQRENLTLEISALEAGRDEITRYRRLLFGYGKGVLEHQVRAALKLLGFEVKEPEEYTGEWDVDLIEPGTGATALGEVEGAESFVDVEKSRQLLDYIAAEAVEGRDHKGLLIGNGFRLTAPGSPERQQQFSDHALRAAQRFQFCLLPTSELLKAVCAVLESPQDDALKARIRESLIQNVGPWSFARD